MTIVSKYKQNCTDTDNKSSDTQKVIILDLWELPSQKYLVYLPSSGAAAVLGQVKNVP